METFISVITQKAPLLIRDIAILLSGAVIGYLISLILFKGVKSLLKDIPDVSGNLVNEKFRKVLQLLFVVISLNIALPLTGITNPAEYYIHKFLYAALILSFAFLLIKVTEFVKSLLYIRFDVSSPDNLDERKARTQIDFLQKIASVIILFISCAIILMSISRVRELGTSILASAGIAGIIIGLAAQKSIANLLAGFQIAFTQPIRLDDVVVVENEFGRIEEITLTYVVVKIWDNRRLVFPISYFLEKPFQNWTRKTSEILGAVYLYTDHSVPVEELRKELARILSQEGKALWDGKTAVVHVTNCSPQGIELRILVSTLNAGLNWDLRCLVREQMISFIQKNYPECLPKVRVARHSPVMDAVN